MTKQIRSMVAALLLGGAAFSLAAPASAESYPRVTGSGENLSVEYGPAGPSNLVGGGRVTVTMQSGMDLDIDHLDPQFTQMADGLVPVTIGSGESASQVYLPRPGSRTGGTIAAVRR